VKVACYCEYCSAILMYPSTAEGNELRCTKCGVLTHAKRNDEATKKARAFLKENRQSEPYPVASPAPSELSPIIAVPLGLLYVVFSHPTIRLVVRRMIAHPFLTLLIILLLLSKLGLGSGGSGSSNPNEGYMTLQDDIAVTRATLKKVNGQPLNEADKGFLEAARTGRLGKPYEDRPDKSKP
jgi:hypothetical protein